MIASLHLAALSPRAAMRALRSVPNASTAPGLCYADVLAGVPMSASLLPTPAPGRAALFAVWEDDEALDRFLDGHLLAATLARGWHTRLQPLRSTTNGWSGMPALVDREQPVDDDEPVAVLTYGRLNFRSVHHFLRSSAWAEGQAIEHEELVASTALARPPRLVATFSLWRSAAGMRDYAYNGAAHASAMREMRRREFHSEYVFARFRPYATNGSWMGSDAARPVLDPT